MPDRSPTGPGDPREQERRWRDLTARVRAGRGGAFAEQWTAFRSIYGNRRAADGPPPAWLPDPESARASNPGRWMRDRGFDSFRQLHRWSARERESFWAEAIRRLGIVFRQAPQRTLDLSAGALAPRWLPGARLNAVDSCLTADARRPAVVVAGERSPVPRVVSYGELRRLAERFADGLERHGFAPQAAIGLYMPMTVECVAAYLGIVLAGRRVVSIADSFAPAELSRRLEIAGAAGLVTVDRVTRAGKSIDLYGKVREAGAPRTVVIPARSGTPPALRDGDLAWERFLGAAGSEPVACDPERVTNVLFSSGTTGDPKAIPWTQLTPIKCAMDGCFHHDVRPGDVVAWPTNIGWMMGPWLIYAALINRATIALWDGLPTGAPFARFVRDAGVTMLGVVPSLVRAWRASEELEDIDWSGVRVFSSTGEPSSREDYLWLMSRAGYRAPVIEYCGGTEIGGGYITGSVVEPASPASFSTPALGLDLVVLDPDGRPVGEGRMGEVYLVPPSIGLSQTLLNRDHDEVYHAGCPAGPSGEPLRRHGDQLTVLARGYYRAQGRADDTMNLGGIKVSSVELEQVLAGHRDVRQAAAISVQPGGEGVERLVVYVVLEPGRPGPPDPEALRGELGRRVAERLNPLFKIHDLVVVETLPYTASNKLLRRELRAAWAARANG